MSDRQFNEIDLRRMLERAKAYRPDFVSGRFIIEARHDAASWEVIVEPDERLRLLVVVTAYAVG